MSAMHFDFQLPTDQEIEEMFNVAAKLDRYQVADQVVRAAAAPVLARARELCPRSDNTGTARKRSAKQRASADWDTPLWKTIKLVVRKYAYSGFAVIGPSWPKGNKAYFNTSPKGNKGHLWGYEGKSYPRKDGGNHIAGQAKPRAQIRNWIVQAFDETKPQQIEATKTKLRELCDKMFRRVA